MRWLAALLLCASSVTHGAQSQVLWSKPFAAGKSAGSNSAAPNLATNAAGDVFAAANVEQAGTTCAYVARHAAATGVEQWNRTLCNGQSIALQADANGDVVVLRWETTFAGKVWVTKMSGSNGSVLWERTPALVNAIANKPAIGIDPAGDVVLAYGTEVSGPISSGPLGLVKFGRDDGTVRWQRSLTRPNASLEETTEIAFSASGDPYVLVVGHRQLSPYDRDWNVVRVSGATGEVAWLSSYDKGRDDWGLGMVVSPAGGVMVAGYSPVSATATAAIVVKLNEASGVMEWERILDTPAFDAAFGLVPAANGGVRAFGSSGSRAALWSVRSDGTLQDQALLDSIHLGSADALYGHANSSSQAAFALVERGYGSLAATGRILRLTADGAVVWSTPTAGDTGADQPRGVVVLPDGSVVSMWESSDVVDNRPVISSRLVKMAAAPTTPARVNGQGLWWRSPGGRQSGWGIDVIHQGSTVFLTWFTYDSAGKPTWFTATGMAARAGVDDSYAGTLYRASGSPFTGTFDASSVSLATVGTATLTFVDADRAVLAIAYADGRFHSIPLSRFLFGSPGRCSFASASAAGRYDDLWWRASEAGWGLDLVHQGDTLFATWYTYGADRSPTWFVASGMTRASDGSYSGALSRTTGSDPVVQWDPSKFSSTGVGTAKLTFSGSNAVFETTVDGVNQSRALTRYAFGSPVSSCP